jgi:hypothetical protein
MMRTRIAVVFLVAVVAGCGGEPKLLDVTGTVLLDGKPTERVEVHFFPVDENPKYFPFRRSLGLTDKAGKFYLTCGGGKRGIEAGDYKVTFSRWVEKGKAVAGLGQKPDDAGHSAVQTLPITLTDPNQTKMTAKVAAGQTDFTFEIASKSP